MTKIHAVTESFPDSLKWLLISLRISGLELYPKNQSKVQRFWYIYSAVSVVCCFCCNVFLFFGNNDHATEDADSRKSTPDLITGFLQNYAHNWLIFSAHCALAATSRSHATKFWDIVANLNRNLHFDKRFFRKIRQHSMVATVIITVTDLSFWTWILLSSTEPLHFTIIRTVMYITSLGIAVKAIVFYVICGFSVGRIYEEINRKIQNEMVQKNCNLERWVSHHGDACEAMRALTESFKALLFIFTLCSFLCTVLRCFRIASKISEPNLWVIHDFAYIFWTIVDIADISIRFWLMCYMADIVTRKAKSTQELICKLSVEDSADCFTWRPMRSSQLNLWLFKVSNSVPSFDIMGFFNLGRGLITTLAGTTLTYFFILLQFKSSAEP